MRPRPSWLLGASLLARMAHAEPVRGEPERPAEVGEEVTVRGERSAAKRRASAEAVTTVDLAVARTRTLDLGELLARTEGLSFRRSGGGGSHAHLSLNGFTGEQIRLFVDGVPLRLTGYALDIGDMPVNLIDHVEVYRGVVPLRFGADSLGGAINLVPRSYRRNAASASYQVGSFGTHRGTGSLEWHDPEHGWVARANAFADSIANNYAIDVQLADPRGRLQAARVTRFHDRYAAYGGSVEVGVIGKSWARRLTLQLAGSSFDKQIQHDARMTVPYGEARSGETAYGLTARYELPIARRHQLELLANVSRRVLDYVDRSDWLYDWRGRRVARRQTPGEIDTVPHDQTQWEHGGMLRASFTGKLDEQQQLRVSSTAALTTRDGEERLVPSSMARHPITAERNLVSLVSGVEYQLDALDASRDENLRAYRLQNIAFVKHYALHAGYEQALPNGVFLPMSRGENRAGFGDALRLRLTPCFDVKLSYELATRQPRADELFGDAISIAPNLELQSEVSHNLNLGPRLAHRGGWGDITFDTNGFWRDTDRLVVLLSHRSVLFRYDNVFRARTLGVESALRWESPGRWLELHGNVTLQDLRNTSDRGAFGAYAGERIPNRPYRFGSWGARLRLPGVFLPRDIVAPFYGGRFTDSFFNTWERQGLREFKEIVPSQLLHNAGISWILPQSGLVTTVEVQNLTDARVYDFFGAQRPGRGVFLKTAIELQ